jgi:superfamily II DNA/RNA helicase
MALRQGQVQILVATDVAARGIDVPTITHVFNFGLPMKAEDYTHRIGRTGRAGRDGLAITFAELRDRRKIFDIEAYTRQPIKAEVVAGLEPKQRIPEAPRPGFASRNGGGGRDARGPGRGFAGPREGGFGGGERRSGFADAGTREFRGAAEGVEVGQVLTVDLFEGVERVDVTGTTKGRGTAGVMKRHHFSGQRATHGVKKVHRHQGGTGMNTTPGRVFKGKRMAGRFGNERSTMRNLRVVRIDREHNLLLVRGAIPGPNGSYVMVRQTNLIKRVAGPGAIVPAKKKAGAK